MFWMEVTLRWGVSGGEGAALPVPGALPLLTDEDACRKSPISFFMAPNDRRISHAVKARWRKQIRSVGALMRFQCFNIIGLHFLPSRGLHFLLRRHGAEQSKQVLYVRPFIGAVPTR